MKKKIVLMMLVSLIGTSVFMSGCGKTGDDTAVEDDEDGDDRDDDEEEEDDDDDRDDEDDDDNDDTDVRPSQPEIVKEIDSDTLLEQLKVFIDGREEWAGTMNGDDTVWRIGYCITDFDHNGRAELTVCREYDYAGYSGNVTYEISEDGKEFYQVSWNAPESVYYTKDAFPDLINYGTLISYFDKDDHEVHYLTQASFDNGNGNYGAVFEDTRLASGAFDSEIYAAVVIQETVDQTSYESTYDYTYFSSDREISESEYYDIVNRYPEEVVTETRQLGFIQRWSYQDMYLKDMDDVSLKNALYDSYCVFNGTLDLYDFESMYELQSSVGEEQDLYADSVGMWSLYSSEVEGDIEYYDWESPYFTTIYVYSDNTLDLNKYEYGESVASYQSHFDTVNYYPMFWIDMLSELGKADEYGVEKYSYEIVGIYQQDNRDYMEIAFDGWDKYENWVCGSHLTFVRDEN